MANKALAKRQKMTIRTDPSGPGIKPRNPYAIAAGQRAAGPHRKGASAQRQGGKRSLAQQLVANVTEKKDD